MRKIFLLTLFSGLLGIIACDAPNPDHATEDQLKEEVMAIHDEVMPRMSEMQRLKKKLQKLAESELPADDAAVNNIRDAILYIEKADEGMMSWMNQFTQPSKLRDNKSHEEIMSYLEEEKKKIQQVKDDMLGSIDRAMEILESYSKAE